jgi:hypothetical protein
MANIGSYGGQMYREQFPPYIPSWIQGAMIGQGSGNSFDYAKNQGWLQPLNMQQQPQQQPAQQPMTTQQIQPQLNRLTQQANNALYGGLLGYNHNLPMMSGGSNPQTFQAPQGDFRSAFAGMQGLLGGR